MTDVLDQLLAVLGSSTAMLYLGRGAGLESGPFVGRLLMTRLPGGAVSLDYEAFGSDRQHSEHSVLGRGDDGPVLVVSHEESPLLSVMHYRGGVFETETGPMRLAVRIEHAGSQLTYAWSWAMSGEPLVEQSRATMSPAKLRHADASQDDVSSADVSSADVSSVDVSSADISSADISPAQ